MRFYDKPGGATIAVSEWRSALQTSDKSRHLPLLYVANEVLQTSKRNRGNRYLEAFSPVLGSSLQFICGQDGSVTEKVRRTVKIWGDRSVFAYRFVAEVLAGLEPFREGGTRVAAAVAASSRVTGKAATTAQSSPFVSVTTDDDGEEDDLFGGDGQKLLDINIDATALHAVKSKAAEPAHPAFGTGAKLRRKRSSGLGESFSPTPGSSSVTTGPVAKKMKALSGQNFLDLFQSIVNLDRKYKSSIGTIESIPASFLDESSTDIEDLVGDELTDCYKKMCQTERDVRRERRTMYTIAVQRRELETDAKRYVNWLRNLAKADDDDIDFCDKLEAKLDLISICHGELNTIQSHFDMHIISFSSLTIIAAIVPQKHSAEAKSLRDKHRAEEAKRRADVEEANKRAMEEEESRRILDDAKMEAAAKPGMVWNKDAREYQYIHDRSTEESWRD